MRTLYLLNNVMPRWDFYDQVQLPKFSLQWFHPTVKISKKMGLVPDKAPISEGNNKLSDLFKMYKHSFMHTQLEKAYFNRYIKAC